MSALRRRTAELLDANRPDDRPSRYLDWFLIAMILANVVAIVLESVASLSTRYGWFFLRFELFSIAVFTLEYLARLWSCVEKPLDQPDAPRQTRGAWARSPLGLIDLLAILPFYLLLLVPLGTQPALILKVFRALRLLRIFKLTRFSPAFNVLLTVARREAPVVLVALSALFLVLMLAAWGIYLLEHRLQPEAFGSIPRAMWWAVITLTTVGYGDVVPLTHGGKIFAGLIALVGVAIMALPAAIMASGFHREVHQRSQSYQHALEQALSKDGLSETEAVHLELMREELGISSSEADRIFKQARNARAGSSHCPHCGEKL